MKIKQSTAMVVAVTVAVAGSGAAAKGPGGPGSGSTGPSMHFKSHLLAQHHHKGRFARNHRNNDNASSWPLYGYYAMPPYDGNIGQGEMGASTLVIVRDFQLPKLNCDKYRETITVPSEQGGTRDITITRC